MLKKILLPLDGSKLSEKALPYAEALARKFEAELVLVHVLEPMHLVADYSSMAYYNQDVWQSEAEMKIYLNGVRGELREHHLPAQTILAKGGPVAETIIDLAYEKGADLIVMSTHGRSGLSRWVHGSIATKVLQHAPCPIFLVRSVESPHPTPEPATPTEKITQ